MASGLVRIQLIEPKLDIVIFCNPQELKVFVYTVEVVHNINTWHYCVPSKLSVLRKWCHVDESWNLKLSIAGGQLLTLGITAPLYRYLKKISALGNKLVEVPEALGSLPCLVSLTLSRNQLWKATNWNWLASPFLKENLIALYLDQNRLSYFPEGILRLRNLQTLFLSENLLTELPATLGNLKHLRNLYVANNKLKILPASIYHKNRFHMLLVKSDCFEDARSMYKNVKQLNPDDFETTSVPSLFQTVGKFIITKRFPFWKYNIPAKLAEYLDGAYYCRCGSIVFCDSTGQVVQREILAEILATSCDVTSIPVAVSFCSYNCYKLL